MDRPIDSELARTIYDALKMRGVWDTIPYKWQCLTAMMCGYLTKAEVEKLANVPERLQEMLIKDTIEQWAYFERDKLAVQLGLIPPHEDD